MFRLYSRVSSKSQDSRGQDADLKRFAADKQTAWYRDKFTGTSMDRPAWNKLTSDLQSGDTLVCWRLDRLGRTAAGLAKLFEELQAQRMNLISLRDNVDLSTASGRLMAHVLASVAAYETEVRRERQLAGIEAAKAQGKRWGGSEKGRRLVVTDEQVKAIRRMQTEGTAKTAMARATGLSRPTIYAILASLGKKPTL